MDTSDITFAIMGSLLTLFVIATTVQTSVWGKLQKNVLNNRNKTSNLAKEMKKLQKVVKKTKKESVIAHKGIKTNIKTSRKKTNNRIRASEARLEQKFISVLDEKFKELDRNSSSDPYANSCNAS